MIKHDVEQGSFEWHKLRQGKVTGTTLKSALGTPRVQETLMYRLISERMTEPQIDDINVKSIQRGKEIEPVARRAVIEETGLNFVETGLLVSEWATDFALSPDAIYEEGGKVVGGLEIKCPDSKKHVEYLINGGLPKEYAEQVMAPFILDDTIQWWYFASFDDRNYEAPLFLLKVTRADFDNLEADREKLVEFLVMVHMKHMEITF